MQALLKESEFTLIDKQHEAIRLIASDAMYVLLYGGARSTKTFTFVRTIVWRAITVSNSRHAILRFRFSHVKASIIYDTFPKVMALCLCRAIAGFLIMLNLIVFKPLIHVDIVK